MSARARRAAALATHGVLAAVLLAVPAEAHLVQTGFGGFYDGVTHLVVTAEDLLLAVGLGLLAGLRGKPEARAVLLILPLAWLLGGVAGALGSRLPVLAWWTMLSSALVGALVAVDAPVPRRPLVALACVAGALHGYADDAGRGPDAHSALALVGAVLAVFTLVTLASALVVALRAGWARIAVRVAGSWVVAIGLLSLGWRLRRGDA